MKHVLISLLLSCSWSSAENIPLKEQFLYSVLDSRLRAVSADGRYAAIYFTDWSEWGETVEVVDLHAGNLSAVKVKAHRVAVAFSSDSQSLIVGGPDGFLTIYDIQSGIQQSSSQPVGCSSIGAISVDASSGSERLFISTAAGAYHVDASTLNILQRFPRQTLARTPTDDAYAFERFRSDVMPDGSLAVESDSSLGIIYFYDLRSGATWKPVKYEHTHTLMIASGDRASLNLPNTVLDVKFSPADSSIYTLEAEVLLKKVYLGKWSFGGVGENALFIEEVPKFDPTMYALSGRGGRALVYPAYASGLCARFIRDRPTSINRSLTSQNTFISTGSVQITPDGRTGITLTDDGFLRVWSLP